MHPSWKQVLYSRFQYEFGLYQDWIVGGKLRSFRDSAFGGAIYESFIFETSPVSASSVTVQGSPTTLHDGSRKRFMATGAL